MSRHYFEVINIELTRHYADRSTELTETNIAAELRADRLKGTINRRGAKSHRLKRNEGANTLDTM